ncbi:nucleotidyltransferase domain-containing protein [Thiorhodovibrio frisius]|uniref:Nucleotidyltransferase family protein n=1 Tax=Thiorhodovibrio frisius TaxID=631362 RepID=H8Z0R4_9GAMM|nr:nucleotidyltransferase domain-containing protein [Thiorhodovibrio frisius]EIC21296.1 nucleotidyltransferase family protein [Thiorhodovibrio frisius]WPL23877.1 hypothetical protein Thiofri_04084 [Thiorhodovibrio frisius]
MRLTPGTASIIRAETRAIFGDQAQVRLFGSRVDDDQRGGDIDLLVELPRQQTDGHRKSLTLAARLQIRLGDQRIDVLLIDPETPPQPIHKQAIANGVLL